MQSPSVSVIVPIYKTERFIKRCLQSLFEQTLSDIEYIFVNDCTPDKSMEILSEVLNTSYSHKKPQVKIVSHDKNRGASVARNSGLSAATGQYVIFADSDDWVKQDAYAMMYEKAVKHDYDIIWSDYYINESETETYKSQYFNPCKTDLHSGSFVRKHAWRSMEQISPAKFIYGPRHFFHRRTFDLGRHDCQH